MKPVDADAAQQFSFDAVDLAANRAGRLSPDQERFFAASARAARKRPGRIYLLLAFVVVGIVAIIAAQPNVPRQQVFIAGGAMVVMLTIIVMITRLNLRAADRMEHLTVEVVEGVPVARPSTNPMFWDIHIGGVRFGVASGDSGVFKTDRVHRVYYTRISRMQSPTILSMEILD